MSRLPLWASRDTTPWGLLLDDIGYAPRLYPRRNEESGAFIYQCLSLISWGNWLWHFQPVPCPDQTGSWSQGKVSGSEYQSLHYLPDAASGPVQDRKGECWVLISFLSSQSTYHLSISFAPCLWWFPFCFLSQSMVWGAYVYLSYHDLYCIPSFPWM